MPYKTIWEKEGAFTKWWGHATSAELIDFLANGQASPNFDDARYSLHDFSDCESFSYITGEVVLVAAVDAAGAKSNPKIRIAVVTDRTDVTEMVKTYINSLFSSYPVRIFPTTEVTCPLPAVPT